MRNAWGQSLRESKRAMCQRDSEWEMEWKGSRPCATGLHTGSTGHAAPSFHNEKELRGFRPAGQPWQWTEGL